MHIVTIKIQKRGYPRVHILRPQRPPMQNFQKTKVPPWLFKLPCSYDWKRNRESRSFFSKKKYFFGIDIIFCRLLILLTCWQFYFNLFSSISFRAQFVKCCLYPTKCLSGVQKFLFLIFVWWDPFGYFYLFFLLNLIIRLHTT